MSQKKPPVETGLHEIVHGVTIAQAHAELYGEQHPEHSKAIRKFLKLIGLEKKELVETLHPG